MAKGMKKLFDWIYFYGRLEKYENNNSEIVLIKGKKVYFKA